MEGLTQGTDVVPWELIFKSDIQYPDAKNEDDMWWQQLSRIEKGTKVLDVYALTAPPGEEGSEERLIGHIYTDSEVTTSVFGDERLHF